MIARSPTRSVSPSATARTFFTAGNAFASRPKANCGSSVGRFAALDGAFSRSAGGDRGAGRALQRGDPAGVIVVRVRVHDQFDVFGLEAKLADVRVDDRRGLRQPAVEQDRALSVGHQHRRDARGSDVVRVAEDAKRLVRACSTRRSRRTCAADRAEAGWRVAKTQAQWRSAGRQFSRRAHTNIPVWRFLPRRGAG